MQTVSLARNAMATRFEIVLHGPNPLALRAAGEQALDEIERVEAQLSLYRPTSEIAHLNARAAHERVRVSPPVFHLLQEARRLHSDTGGTFDITIGPLVRCWGFMGGTGSLPAPEQVAEARAHVGMSHVELHPEDSTVSFDREGVMLDLGGIGKGYALDRAVDVLREAGMTSALLHGGTSSVLGLGHPPDQESWTVAVEYPAVESPTGSEAPARPNVLARIPLRDEALSVSAVWGRSFQARGKTFGHVLDPRTGEPVSRALLAAVVCPSATAAEGYSTGLLVLGEPGHAQLTGLGQGLRTLLLQDGAAPGTFHPSSRGIEIQAGS